MARSFALRRSRLTWMLRALAPGRWAATVDERTVTVRMGWLGRAVVPVEMIAAVSTMRWPWWAGAGVRLSKNLVVFVPSSGEVALLDLTDGIRVRAPLPWTTGRVAIAAADLPAFVEAVAAVRGGAAGADASRGPGAAG